MKKLSLGLLLLAFIISFNLTYAQDSKDSKDSKTTQKTEVTKPTLTKSEVTKSPVTKSEVKNSAVTKSEVTKPDVTNPVEIKQNEQKLISPVDPIDITKAVITPGTGKPINAVCIVSGEELDAKVTADYKGKTYGFCCKTCLRKFTKDPEKYVTKYESKTHKSKT